MTSIRKYSGQLGCRQCFATESKDMNQLVHACSGVRKKLPIGESSHKKERKKKSVLPRTVRRWVWTASCGEFLEGRSLPQLICHCSWRTPFQLAYPFPSVPASRKTDLFLHCFLKIDPLGEDNESLRGFLQLVLAPLRELWASQGGFPQTEKWPWEAMDEALTSLQALTA